MSMKRKIDALLAVVAPPAVILTAVSVVIVLVLLVGSLDAWNHYGLSLLTSTEWRTSEVERGRYGIAAPLAGTFVVAALATSITTAASIAVAVYINEYSPQRVRELVESFLYVMAALPTIVYGMWGIQVLAPLFRQLSLSSLCPRGSPTGQSAFTAALVVSLMMTPYSVAMVSEAYRSIPFTYIEALHSLGAKRFERARILLGMVKSTIVAAVLLSLGRAVGETTIVALTVGGSFNVPLCPFEQVHTATSLIANYFGYAYLYPGLESVLLAAALVVLLGSSLSVAAGIKLARTAVKLTSGETQ